MIVTQRRLEANRRNAARSTGPKTPQGKLIARNNALRHGLAQFVSRDPLALKAIEASTAILAQGRNDVWYRELARSVAEADAELARIRDVRSQILRSMGDIERANAQAHAAA